MPAIIIFVFLVPYSAAVYKGLGSMFTTIFPTVSVNTWMLVIAVLTAIYLVLGGYVATAYTDFVQGIIMIVGVFAMVVAIVKNPNVGGFSHFFSNLASVADNGDKITGAQLTSWYGGANWKFLCVNILLTSFGTWGLPQMVSKYYAVKDIKSIHKATVISTVFALIIGAGAYFVGSLSRLVLNNQLPEGGVDAVIPNTLLTALGDPNIVTTIILAVILILLLSASMSTLSSIVLSSASAISVDLIPAVNKNYSGKNQMILTRALCLLFVALFIHIRNGQHYDYSKYYVIQLGHSIGLFYRSLHMGYLFKENNKSRCLGRYDSWIFDCCGYNNRAYINE